MLERQCVGEVDEIIRGNPTGCKTIELASGRKSMEVYLAAQSDFFASMLVMDAFQTLKKLSIKLMINSTTKFHRTLGYRCVYSEKSLWVWGSKGYVRIAEALRQLKQVRIYYPPEALIASSE